jgi:prepilin-type processing-associated H-X9-DG protein
VYNWWAILGVMLSVLFVFPPFALGAAILSYVALRPGRVKTHSEKRAAQIGLFLGVLGILLTPVELLCGHWAMRKTEQVRCRQQLLALASSMPMYTNEYHGYLPPDLATFAKEMDIAPAVFVCEDSTETVASSMGQLSAPGHVSYVYLGAGKRLDDVKSPATEIMMYEQPHHFGGMNVAFYDGHVEFVPRARATKVLAELRAGQNPPPSLSIP